MKHKPAKWAKQEMQLRASVMRRKMTFEPLERRNVYAVLHVGIEATFQSIQSAVEHARTDDVIDVRPGVYAESINWSRMGAAIGRQPGNLTIRGTGVDVILRSPQGSTILNTTPLVGDLVLRQLVLEAPASQSDGTRSAIALHEIQGSLTISNNIFQEIAHHAVDLSEVAGELIVTDNQFLGIGDDDRFDAVRLREISGSAIFHDNTFDNVKARAISLANTNSNLLFVVDDNSVLGDVATFSTTNGGFNIQLGGPTISDITVVNNQIDGVSEFALRITAGDSARLQTRIAENGFSNLRGPTAVSIELSGNAQAALSAESNTVTDTTGSAFTIVQLDASQLNGVLFDNLFLNIGDASSDQGLVLTSSSSGTRNLRIHTNDFATISGDGLVLTSTGTGTTNAFIADNVFTDVDGTSGLEAIAAFRAETAGPMRLQLESNTVLDAEQDAYFLEATTGEIKLAGTLATPAAEIESNNIGAPVTIAGTVLMENPSPLSEWMPFLLGNAAWLDTNGDGLLDPNEPELPGVTIQLSGTETATGIAVDRATITDSLGKYNFSALLPGEYTLTVLPPQGRSLALSDQGADDFQDSDFDRSTRSLTLNAAGDDFSIDVGLWANWQNPVNHLDVDDDSVIVPRDVLLIINDLNANGARALPGPFPVSDTPRFLDVDGNGFVAPLDVLQVINYLNALAAEGEGEAVFNMAVDCDEQRAGSAEKDRDILFAALALEISSRSKRDAM